MQAKPRGRRHFRANRKPAGRRPARVLGFEGLEGRRLLDASGWQNPVEPLNVNDDYFSDGAPIVSPIDALIGLVNLNASGPRTLPLPANPPPYFDVNADGDHTSSDVLPVINHLFGLGDVAYGGRVEVRLEAANANGDSITTAEPGDVIVLRAFVRDDRLDAAGIFAAYLDVTYDPTRASDDGAILAGSDYVNVASGNSWQSGRIDEAGGTSQLPPLGGGEFLLFQVPLRLTGTGSLTFFSEPATGLGHEILAYGSNLPVASSQVHYGSLTLDIVNPVSFVDANNNRVFDDGIDVPLEQGELADGRFSTAIPEGGYTTVIRGAGLVINQDVQVLRDLDIWAQGVVVVNASLDATRDLKLRGRDIVVHGGLSAGRDVLLHAYAVLDAVGVAIQSGRDLTLTAHGADHNDSAGLAAMRLDHAQLTAGRSLNIAVRLGSVSMVDIQATAGVKAQIIARRKIFADMAEITAGSAILLNAGSVLGTPTLIAPKVKVIATDPH